MNFSALALGSKACNCPNLYFDSSVKLFIPHVPDSLNWCSNCFILEVEGKIKQNTNAKTDSSKQKPVLLLLPST